MASHVYVLDSSFKRTQVKVTPGKSLREVLEEACKSRRLNPEEYTLRTQGNKNVDLSQPFRLSGLSAGAKLQLTQASKSPGVVSVALQLPESDGAGRLSDKFPSTTSLWLILRKFEDAVAGAPAKKLNLTQRGVPSNDSGAGRLLYEQPCLHVVGRNFESFNELQKTLGQLGLNGGSALLRLNFKKSGHPLEEAMAEISTFFSTTDGGSAPRDVTAIASGDTTKAAETNSTPIVTASVPGDDNLNPDSGLENKGSEGVDPGSSESTQEQMDTTEPTSLGKSTQQHVASLSSATPGISVFRPPYSNTPAAALQPDDPSVFEPTIDHAKAHQAALNRAGKNQRLPSDKELAEQDAQRQEALAAVRNVVVRVRYPDQSQTETTITATETAADFYARIAGTLAAAPEEPFELRYTATSGMKAHLQLLPRTGTTRLVRDCGFRGKTMVTLVWAEGASAKARQPPSLKEEFRNQAVDLKVELNNTGLHGSSSSNTSSNVAHQNNAGASNSDSGSGKKVDVEARMKRFLGLGKK